PLPRRRRSRRGDRAHPNGPRRGPGGRAPGRVRRRLDARGVPVSERERIGLIAGSGRFPVLFAETARRRGVDVIAVAHRGETAPELVHHVHAITWVQPGQLQTLIDALRGHHVTRAVMVGGIAKPRLFREILPDARALAAIARVGKLRDDLLLRSLAEEL